MECDCCKKKMTIRDEQEKKKLDSRINRIIGQLNGIKKMVDDNRYCDDILIQVSAIEKSVKSLASEILTKHLDTCIRDSIKEGDDTIIDEISELFKRFN